MQVAQLGDKKFENPQTVNLQKILNDTIDIEGLKAEKKVSEGEQSQEGEGATAVKKPGKKLVCWESRLGFWCQGHGARGRILGLGPGVWG